jgi:hypothetical protein
MSSSAKFLSPIVTAGLPAPGPVAAGAGAAVELLDDDVLLLLPHAANPVPTSDRVSLALKSPHRGA